MPKKSQRTQKSIIEEISTGAKVGAEVSTTIALVFLMVYFLQVMQGSKKFPTSERGLSNDVSYFMYEFYHFLNFGVVLGAVVASINGGMERLMPSGNLSSTTSLFGSSARSQPDHVHVAETSQASLIAKKKL